MGDTLNDYTIRNKNIRTKLNTDLQLLKQKQKCIDVATLAKKYNTTRTTIGRMLAERAYEIGDVRRARLTQNYCPAVWEFIDAANIS
jgi:hypothetical protein